MKENQEIHRMMIRVQKYLDIPLEKMTNGCRKDRSIYARHMFCYMCNVFHLGTLEEMGDTIKKNHATAHNGIKRIREWQESNPAIRADINALKNLTVNTNSCKLLNKILQETDPSKFQDLLDYVQKLNYKNNM